MRPRVLVEGCAACFKVRPIEELIWVSAVRALCRSSKACGKPRVRAAWLKASR